MNIFIDSNKMTDDYIKFVERLKKIRAENDLSQLDMAQKMGLNTHAQISKIENLVTFVSVESLIELNKHCPIDMNYLILGKSSMDQSNKSVISLTYAHINLLAKLARQLSEIAADPENKTEVVAKTSQAIDMIDNEISHIMAGLQRIKTQINKE